jgi:hypothetical protein
MAIRSFFLFTLVISFSLHASEVPQVVPSELKSVTVYRSGAEMVHLSTAQLAQGSQELVIRNISNQIDINSVQVNCPSAVTIMGVEFSNNFLETAETSLRLKSLRDSAEKIQREAERITIQIQTTTDLLEVLKANRELKGSQTGLSVSELVKLMDYYKTKSTELQNELAAQKELLKKLNANLQKWRNQIWEEENLNTKKAGQMKLQLSVATSGRYDFTLSYITPNAHWSPFYDIRVQDIKSPLKLVYRAKINQTTGLDWKKVRLSLSTSLPSQWGQAPVLRTWFLSYINPVHVMERSLSNRVQSMDSYKKEYKAAGEVPGIALRGTTSLNKEQQPLYIVNGVPMGASDFNRLDPSSIKNIQTLRAEEAASIYGSRASNGAVIVTLKDGLEDYVSVSDQELNVQFDIDLPYDVPTNGKEQTATLREYSVPALYKYYSVPRLDKDGYLLAEVNDWEKLNLMPGEANIIFEGTYVGKSFIDPAATTDTLNLTLGRDKRVVIKKEKLADFSSTKFLGSNKLQKLTYEISVKNNKKDTVRMLLKDQYPLSTNKEIEVELIDDGGADINRETGVLSWKLELAPGAVKKVRFAYSVKHPREKSVNAF